MRRSIFDILEEEMDLEYGIETIMKLFNESRIYGYNLNYSLEDYFDQECIHLWKNRKYVTSSKQMRERLGVTDEDIRAGLDDKQILVLLEYILGRYQAGLTFRKKRYYLGRYDTLEGAAKARKQAEIMVEEYLEQYREEERKEKEGESEKN